MLSAFLFHACGTGVATLCWGPEPCGRPGLGHDIIAPLGTFDIDPSERLDILIENRGTDGYVTVDALQVLPVPNP